jgi:hypothetical protein
VEAVIQKRDRLTLLWCGPWIGGNFWDWAAVSRR